MIALLSTLAIAGRPAPLPEPLAAVPWSAPVPVRRVLSSGLPVFVVPDHEVPLFDVRMIVKVGEHADPSGLEGLCAVTFDLLDEGAGEQDAAALASALRALGAALTTSCAGDTATIEVSGIARNLEPALDLFAAVIRSPRLAEADLQIARERHVQRLAVQLQRPDAIADRIQAGLEYGEAYLGRSPTAASLRAITIGNVHGLWSKRVGPAVGALVAGGDVDPDALVALLEARLGEWRRDVEPVPVEPTPRADTAGKLFVVDLPGAAQSALRAWVPIGGATDPARFPLDIATEALGGSFSSRLNLNLREDKGWTYGARCGAVYRAGPGLLSCATLVRADATAGAVTELRRELDDVRGARPITAEETEDFRGSLLRAWPLEHETNGSFVAELGRIWRRDLPEDWADRWRAAIGAATPADVASAVRMASDPERTTFLVVGDLAKVRTELEAVGLPLVELRVE